MAAFARQVAFEKEIYYREDKRSVEEYLRYRAYLASKSHKFHGESVGRFLILGSLRNRPYEEWKMLELRKILKKNAN